MPRQMTRALRVATMLLALLMVMAAPAAAQYYEDDDTQTLPTEAASPPAAPSAPDAPAAPEARDEPTTVAAGDVTDVRGAQITRGEQLARTGLGVGTGLALVLLLLVGGTMLVRASRQGPVRR
jgi:uncharacterized surface anchored protein